MIKEFLKQNKQKIIKLLLAILTLVAIALVTLAALYFFDVIYFDEKGGINFTPHAERTRWKGHCCQRKMHHVGKSIAVFDSRLT